MTKRNFESNVQLMSEQWSSLKEDLYNGEVEYNYWYNSVKNISFFDRFDNIFKETCNFFEVDLSDIKPIYRSI